MSLNNVNVAMVENNTIVKTDVLRAEKAGTAVKIKAVKGDKYILAEGEKGYAPENITVKRVGKDLHVMLEGTDENQPQLIIEDFFTNPGELVGKAEDGQWHEFISSDGDSDHEAAFLMDGESSALVLGAGAIGALDGLALAPFALSPALLALGALAGLLAATGLATAIAHNRDKGSDHGGSDGGEGGGGGIGPVIKAPVWSEVVDDHGDFQGPIQNGGLTDDNTPTFGGTGTPGNTIIIRDKGEVIGSTIVGEDGSWTWTPENPLPDGEHHITPVERDEHGNESVPGEEFVVIIDTDPPARPEIGQVFDDVEPKMGPVANGGYTNDETPTFSGEGQTPGDTIIIIDNGKEIGSVIVGEDGSWSYTPDVPFKDGDHNIEIVARDPAGNRSEPSDPWLVIVDTEIPGKPGTGTTGGLDDIIDDVGPVTGSIAKGGVTDDSTPTLEGSYQRPGTIVTIIDNGEVIGSTVADANGGWRFTPPELPAGEHSFSIIIETPTGYVSPESDPWLVVIDLEAPEAPVIKEIIDDQGAVTGPINDGDVTDDAQPKISGTAEAGSTVIIYDKGVEIGRAQADAAGNWEFTPVPPLQNGDHEISAKAQDQAGNIGDASNSIGFELIAGGNATAPSIIGAWDDVEAFTGLLQSGAKTNDARPELRGTAPAGETVTIIMDGRVQGTAIADGKGQWSWTPAADIADGTHNFRAETHDDAGNPAATGNFQLVIDTQAPDAAKDIVADDNVGPVVGPIGDGDTTDDSTPTIGGEGEPGGTVIIKDGDDVIGSTIVGDDGRWEFTPAEPLPEGEHSLVVVIRDEAGNESAPSDPIDFIVDTGNVVISIDYAYDDVEAHTGNLAAGSVTNDDTPTLHGKATANSIVTIMNGDVVIGSVKADSFGRWSFTTPALEDGSYSFTATATNAKTGAVSAPTAEFNLVIDTEAPTKPGEGGTGGDGIGDIIDDVGPIRGSVKPGDVTDDTTPTLEGGGLQKDDVVTIIDNGEVIGSAVADENGGWQFTPNPPLNQGEHEFTIIVTDPAGNRSEPSDPYLIVVDTDAPAAPVIKEIIDDQGAVTGPINNGDVTDDAQPKISGTAEAGSTVIVYDKGVEIGRTEADAAGNWEFTPVPPLLNGDHEISAKAQDQAGNISDESNSIGFDLLTGGVPSAPAIVNVIDDVGAITGNIRPGGVTDDTQPTIVGTAKPGHIVTILIDGQAQGTVVADSKGQWSFTPTTALPEGPHAIVAAATDPQGNPMPSSGEYNIVVDTTAPDVGSQSLIDNVGDKVGPIASGDTTDDSTPTYSGVAEPGSTVIIKDGDREIGRVPANSKGEWSFTPATPLPDGPHSLSHQIQDPAGNLSAASTPIDFVVDTSAVVVSITNVFDDAGSVTGTLNTGSVTDDTTPTLNGRATANALVTIKNGTEVIGSVYADARGNWQFTPTVELKEGHYNFTASAEAKNGSVAVSDKFELTIDITPPDNNGIGDIKDNVGGIVNPIQDGGLTDDTTPELVGSGQEPGDVVTIIDNGKPIGSTVVGDDGSWSYTPETPLPEGSHDFTIIVTDPAGNDSQESDPWTVIIDTKPPVAPSIDTVWDDVDPKQGDVAKNGYTNDQRPELRGSAAANAIVIIYQDGVVKGSVTADASGKWKWMPSVDLTDATFNFTASQVSAAGVEGDQSAKYTITVDTKAPDAPVISSVEDNVAGGVVGNIANGGLTNDDKPTLSGRGEANALIIVRVNGNDFASTYANAQGDWKIELPTALGQGTQTLSVVAQDAAGNTSPSSNSWSVVVDSIAPDAPAITLAEDNVAGGIIGDLANGGLTNDNTPKLSGTAEANALVFIRINGGGNFASVYADGSGKWSLELPTALGEGVQEIRAFAQDAAGNLSAQSNLWKLTVDTIAPDAPSITRAEDNVAGGIVGDLANGGVTNDNRPKLSGTAEANALVFIRVDGGGNFASVYADSSGKWSLELPTALGEGSHDFRVFAQDAAGNLSGQSNLWKLTVDTIAPDAPSITRAEDNVAGGIVGDLTNGGLTNDNRPKLSGTAEANALVIIRVDGNNFASVKADGSGNWSLELPTALADGNREIRAFAQDAAGNLSAQSNLWKLTVDTIAPDAPSITRAEDNVAGGIVGDLANGGVTNDNRPKLSGTAEANALVFIRVDGNNFASLYADGSGKWSLELPTALGEGTHEFRVFAQDAAGNLSAQSNLWKLTVDTIAPGAPSITRAEDNVAGGIVGDLANGGLTNDNRPKLSGTAEANALVFIRVDGGGNFASVKADGSGKWSLELPTALGEGTHEFRVFAQDAAGNLSAQSNLWKLTVDTIAPNGPVITSLVDNVPGGVVGEIANGGITNDNKPTLKGTSEANALITIRVDNIVWGSVRADGNGKWELELTKEISDGSHQIRAFAQDAAGNTSAQSNLWNVVVETSTTHSASVTFTTEPWGYSVGYSYNKNGFGLVKTGRYEPDYIQFTGSYIEVDSGPLEVSLLNGQQAKSFTVNTQQQSFTYHYRVFDVNGQFMYEIDSTGTTTLETTSGKGIGKVEISPVPNGHSLYFWGFSAEVYDTPVQQTGRSMMMFDHNGDDDIAQATAVDEGDKDSDQTDDNSAQTYLENNQLTILHSESVLNFNQLVEPLKDINVVDMTNNEKTVLNISVSDVLAHGEEGAFTADDTKQLMIKGDAGDVVNLSDLLPDGTDPGNWAKAEGTVTVGGVQYEVYQHTGAETELLVQLGVQTNLNNH